MTKCSCRFKTLTLIRPEFVPRSHQRNQSQCTPRSRQVSHRFRCNESVLGGTITLLADFLLVRLGQRIRFENYLVQIGVSWVEQKYSKFEERACIRLLHLHPGTGTLCFPYPRCKTRPPAQVRPFNKNRNCQRFQIVEPARLSSAGALKINHNQLADTSTKIFIIILFILLTPKNTSKTLNLEKLSDN